MVDDDGDNEHDYDEDHETDQQANIGRFGLINGLGRIIDNCLVFRILISV